MRAQWDQKIQNSLLFAIFQKNVIVVVGWFEGYYGSLKIVGML
jgi:hypothetical protein